MTENNTTSSSTSQPQPTVDEVFKQALTSFNSQRYTESDQLCTAILKTVPNHIDTINLLGVIAQRLNRHDLAINQFNRAIEIDNNRGLLYYNLAISLDQIGQIANACNVLQAGLKKDPENSEILQYFNLILVKIKELVKNQSPMVSLENLLQLAIFFHKAGNLDQAEKWYKTGIDIQPDNPIALCNYATIAKSQGRVDESISNYKKAILQKPDYGDAYYNLGTVLIEQYQYEEAVDCLQKAITLLPNLAEAHYSMGLAYYYIGRADDAHICFNNVLLQKPDYTEAYLYIANIYKAQGKLTDAINSYEKAIAIQPNNPNYHNNLGNILKSQYKTNKAYDCYKQAIAVDPNYVLAYNNIGDLKVDYGDLEEGLGWFKKADAIQPTLELKIKIALSQSPIISSLKQVNSFRDGLQKEIAKLKNLFVSSGEPLEKVNITNFYSAYHGLNERELQSQIAQLFLHSFPMLSSPAKGIKIEKKPQNKLRIGFLSSFLYGHTIGYLNKGIIQHLNRDRFEIVVFRLPDNQDDYSRQIDSLADKVVAINRELESTKNRVLQENLDVLYYPDIGMCPFTYYMAFFRLAPVQCTTLGHPITTGIPNMDYFISTQCLEKADAQRHYSETLYLMQRLPCYYYPAKITNKQPSRSDFSLPDGGNIYVCSQTLYKLHPDFDYAIMDLLVKDPNGWVVFIAGKHDNWEKLLRKRWQNLTVNRSEQILFLPRLSPDQFVTLFQIADVVLDTFHFSGGKTTSEAISVGAPVVTLPGEFQRGRITLACYKLMGVMDLVAKDAEQYIDLAYRLANDAKWRKTIVDKIKANSHKIIEDSNTVREFEKFFETTVAKAMSK
ncbi:MAG: tetratricopeptide repeat protein [Magnetococcales bacterium]|nr:tetratricopeptide repeat protein [Magnetococcales bacterium]